jgi:hypothetical protein
LAVVAEAVRLTDRRVLAALRLTVVAVVVLQRFAVPGIGTALCLPVVLAVLGYLGLGGALAEDHGRTRLYLLAAGGCCAAALLSALHFASDWSLKSLALLVVLYLPFCLRLRPEHGHLYRPLLEFFNALMAVLACVAVAQWLAQFAGWTYRDLLDWVPDSLLVQGYNTTYPVQYGSPLMKANAVVFLEPSFCSQFLAVALVVQLLLGGRRWRLPLYAAGLLATVAGTGIVLLGVGLAVLAVRRGLAWTGRVLLVLLLLGVLLQGTLPGRILAGRTTERTEQDSSTQARFVTPYVLVAEGLARDTATLFVGRGPGVVSNSSGARYFNTEGIDANYPVVPKLAAEYGAVAAALFVVFMVVALTRRTPSVTVSAMMLAVYFFLSGSLLQPHTVLAAWAFTSLFATRPRAGPGEPEPRHRQPATLGAAP